MYIDANLIDMLWIHFCIHGTPVKFQGNLSETAGGVAYTMYLLLEGGWKVGRKDDGRKGEYYILSLFFEKAGDKS